MRWDMLEACFPSCQYYFTGYQSILSCFESPLTAYQPPSPSLWGYESQPHSPLVAPISQPRVTWSLFVRAKVNKLVDELHQ